MKKAVKSKNPEEDKMTRYLGALNEIHGENLKGIREGSILVNKNLEDIKETLSEHSKILDSHSKILNSHTEMIGTLMEDVSSIRSDLKRKVDYDDFLSLLKRVQKIEAKLV